MRKRGQFARYTRVSEQPCAGVRTRRGAAFSRQGLSTIAKRAGIK